MTAYRGVDFFDRHYRSGHSLYTNQQRYLDQNILAMTLRCVYALNGWVYATPNKYYQNFIALALTWRNKLIYW